MRNEGAEIQWPDHVERALKSLRKPLEGVGNIVKFNWPFYLSAAAVIFFLPLGLPSLPDYCLAPCIIAYLLASSWFGLSLLVAYLVYDVSDLYRYTWLLEAAKGPPRHILNVHAGFDETSRGLKIIFPDAEIAAFDFYSPERNTEPSIARARAAMARKGAAAETGALQSERVGVCGWRLDDNSQDMIQLFMAAHELRQGADRQSLFREIHRVLKPDGELIVVEHLRDLANFVAFGPGFMHFYPRSQWLRLAEISGFRLRKERALTMFVRVFYLCKQ